MSEKLGGSVKLVEKWEAALDGINDSYTRRVTAQLLENQAAAVLAEKFKLQEEALTPGSTTVGQLGTFQKFAFPLVRRVYPELIANRIVGVQPMNGPVSQIFYIGHTRAGNIMGTYGQQQVYGKYKLTYRGMTTSAIGSVSGPGGTWHTGTTTGNPLLGAQATGAGFDVSNLINVSGHEGHGGASATFGGQIASWPDPRTTLGWSVSAGEQLRTSGIPEITFHIEQQPVVARTRKMRALWTIEASQDLKAYHDLDLERELTDLLSKELALEIDRELVEDLRMIAYGLDGSVTLDTGVGALGGGWDPATLDNANSQNFQNTAGRDPNGNTGFTPSAFLYDFVANGGQAQANVPESNVWVVDLTNDSAQFTGTAFAPQHVGHKYSNLLAAINFASQDIYRTTFRGPGTFLVTSPIVGSMLESAAKLEGGLAREDKPSNMGTSIEYRGKFAGKYDLYIDPMYPEDEVLVGYKGSNAMDAGFVYAPYIPLQPLPTITDPETFQPRKGILTRYGKAAITPQARFYRIIRIIGGGNFLNDPFATNASINGTTAT
jgi:hypothetical protein